MTKERSKKVAFTKEVKKFICDKMCEGLTIAEICSKYPAKVPFKDSIYRKSVQDSEFAEQLNQAYTAWLMHHLDEMNRIAATPALKLFPDAEDWRDANETKRSMMDASKFMLGKMAPVLSKRFDKTTKVEVETTGVPQIAIMNYAVEALPDIKDATKVIDQIGE